MAPPNYPPTSRVMSITQANTHMNATGVAELDLATISIGAGMRAPETGVHLPSAKLARRKQLTWLHPQFAQLPTASLRGGCFGWRCPVMGLILLQLADARFVDSSADKDEAPLRRWRRAGPLEEEREVFLAIVGDDDCDESDGRARVMMWSVEDGE